VTVRAFVATSNRGKLLEILPLIREYFPNLPLFEGRAPHGADEIENTFVGNALIKAHALALELQGESTGEFWVLSDDSGLEVDALGGAPGVHSARYAGTQAACIQRVVRELQALAVPLEKRTCRYRCALVLLHVADGATREWVGRGAFEGKIVFDARGASGFGYDPIFLIEPRGKTMAELEYDDKNSFSHRRHAFEDLRSQVGTRIGG